MPGFPNKNEATLTTIKSAIAMTQMTAETIKRTTTIIKLSNMNLTTKKHTTKPTSAQPITTTSSKKDGNYDCLSFLNGPLQASHLFYFWSFSKEYFIFLQQYNIKMYIQYPMLGFESKSS